MGLLTDASATDRLVALITGQAQAKAAEPAVEPAKSADVPAPPPQPLAGDSEEHATQHEKWAAVKREIESTHGAAVEALRSKDRKKLSEQLQKYAGVSLEELLAQQPEQPSQYSTRSIVESSVPSDHPVRKLPFWRGAVQDVLDSSWDADKAVFKLTARQAAKQVLEQWQPPAKPAEAPKPAAEVESEPERVKLPVNATPAQREEARIARLVGAIAAHNLRAGGRK